MEQAPGYERANQVYTILIDLSLDEFKDIDQATYWLDFLKNNPATEQAYILYAEGRISLFKMDFITARQQLTRSDRATDSSNLSERARYYLSLTDFYAGDYEFAEIQLRSLERRHTSFYANDAIKLRMWIRNGQRADTTGSVLKAIGEGFFSIHTGKYTSALPPLEPILANVHNPFSDDLTIELSSLLPAGYNHLKFLLLERQINARPYSPLLERMMWDRAVMSEEIHNSGGITMMDEPLYMFSFFKIDDTSGRELTNEERFFKHMNTETTKWQLQSYSDFDLESVSKLYEEIIVEFPDGFYATFAREKLQTIESTIL